MPSTPPSSSSSRPSQSPRSRTGKKLSLKSITGFTLAEVMIAFTVMVTGVTGSLTALTGSLKSLDTARCSTLATQMAQSQIEKLRLLSWNQLTGVDAVGVATTDFTASQQTIDPLNLVPNDAQATAARFDLIQTVTKVIGREDDMLEIQLKATWKTMGSISQSRTFTTRYVKGGLYDYYNRGAVAP